MPTYFDYTIIQKHGYVEVYRAGMFQFSEDTWQEAETTIRLIEHAQLRKEAI